MNYPYANGIISAIEGRLLNRGDYAKLAKMEKDEFLQQLRDFGYGEGGDSLEDIIASELAVLRQFFDEISPDRRLTDLFFIEIDAVNIKAAFKRKLFSAATELYMPGGNISAEALELAVFADDYSLLDKNSAGLVREIAVAAGETADPRRFSALADKIVYRDVFRRMPLLADSALKAYFQTVVDTKNIVMLLRSKALGWDLSRFGEMFLSGGLIPYRVFEEARASDNETLAVCFKDYYAEKIGLGLKKYFQSGNIDVLERYFEQLIINVMKNHRYDSFGIGPIIYYYLARQAEASNIRLLYAGDEADLIEY